MELDRWPEPAYSKSRIKRSQLVWRLNRLFGGGGLGGGNEVMEEEKMKRQSRLQTHTPARTENILRRSRASVLMRSQSEAVSRTLLVGCRVSQMPAGGASGYVTVTWSVVWWREGAGAAELCWPAAAQTAGGGFRSRRACCSPMDRRA
ncbi:hypothetical protein SRHO_G00093330 [Serrasalmus rhombeus]